VKGIDFKPGVVGEDHLAGGEDGIVDRFERGVGGEGSAVFIGRGHGGESREWFDYESVSLGDDAKVAEFPLAGGGGIKAEGHGESVTGASGVLSRLSGSRWRNSE
jgi:hypothetical protein